MRARIIGLAIAATMAAPVVLGHASTASAATAQFFVTGYVLRGYTATGTYVHPGTCAVDPRIIPLGSYFYISGIGECHAEDTGGAIIGYRIDVWVSTVSQAYSLTGWYTVTWGNSSQQVLGYHATQAPPPQAPRPPAQAPKPPAQAPRPPAQAARPPVAGQTHTVTPSRPAAPAAPAVPTPAPAPAPVPDAGNQSAPGPQPPSYRPAPAPPPGPRGPSARQPSFARIGISDQGCPTRNVTPSLAGSTSHSSEGSCP